MEPAPRRRCGPPSWRLPTPGATAPIGFANPTLYNVAGGSSYSSTFSDITSGNNDYTGTNDGLYPAGTAYDMASGLGSPNGSALPAALCSGGCSRPSLVASRR